jgi:signal transduction histidine kinase
MEVMLREILDASIIDVDRLAIERQPIRLQQVAHEAAIEVRRRTEKHRLVVEFPSDFPIIEADPRWTKQALRNILDNAVKYSPDGGLIVIRGEVRPSDVVVSVADQGIGISPEDLIPLFERYFRATAATRLHIDGTGLGLPIARTMVEAQNGRIWVDSKVGEGTTVFFSLPRTDSGLSEDE